MALPAGSRRLTTIVTISVVLVAGSAAALVNSQVLSRSADDAISSVPVSLVEQPTTTSMAAIESTSSVTVPTETTLSPTQTKYQADAAGSVVVDTDGDRLTIVSVEPSDGYRVESMSQGIDPNNVSVFFRGPDGQLYEFHAGMMGGIVGASIAEVDSTSSSTPSGGTSGSGGTTVTTTSSGSGSGSVTSTTDDDDDVTSTTDDDDDDDDEEEEDEEEEDDD